MTPIKPGTAKRLGLRKPPQGGPYGLFQFAPPGARFPEVFKVFTYGPVANPPHRDWNALARRPEAP